MGAALLAGGGLAILLTAFVAYGGAFTKHAEFSGFLGWLQRQATDTVKAAVWITEQVVPLTAYILHELGHVFNETYTAAARWIGGLENYIQMTGGAFVNLGVALNDWSKWLVDSYIPKLVKGIPHDIGKVTTYIVKKVKVIERTIVKFAPLALVQAEKAIVKAFPIAFPNLWREFNFLKKHWKALLRLLAMAGSIAVGVPGLVTGSLRKWVERELAKLWKMIRAKEKAIVAVVSGAAVAVALRKLGLGWIRCNKVGKLGKAACRMPAHLFDDFLGLLTDVLILTNVCQVIPLLNRGFNLVEPVFEQLTTGTAALACEARQVKPKTLAVPALHLPPPNMVGMTLHLP